MSLTHPMHPNLLKVNTHRHHRRTHAMLCVKSSLNSMVFGGWCVIHPFQAVLWHPLIQTMMVLLQCFNWERELSGISLQRKKETLGKSPTTTWCFFFLLKSANLKSLSLSLSLALTVRLTHSLPLCPSSVLHCVLVPPGSFLLLSSATLLNRDVVAAAEIPLSPRAQSRRWAEENLLYLLHLLARTVYTMGICSRHLHTCTH